MQRGRVSSMWCPVRVVVLPSPPGQPAYWNSDTVTLSHYPSSWVPKSGRHRVNSFVPALPVGRQYESIDDRCVLLASCFLLVVALANASRSSALIRCRSVVRHCDHSPQDEPEKREHQLFKKHLSPLNAINTISSSARRQQEKAAIISCILRHPGAVKGLLHSFHSRWPHHRHRSTVAKIICSVFHSMPREESSNIYPFPMHACCCFAFSIKITNKSKRLSLKLLLRTRSINDYDLTWLGGRESTICPRINNVFSFKTNRLLKTARKA